MEDIALPQLFLAILKKRRAFVDRTLRANGEDLVKICTGLGYAAYSTVIAFEKAFGGLMIPDELGATPDGPTWIFGTYACLTQGGHRAPRGGDTGQELVPVAYSPNDVIFFLNEKGEAFAQDTVEDVSASFYAIDGFSLMCRIALELAQAPNPDQSQETSLSLVSQNLKIVPDFIAVLPHLRELDLSINKIEDISDSLWRPTKLTRLDLSFNPFKVLPDGIGRLESLRSLILRGCQISTLPQELCGLKNLTSLSLTECELLNVDRALSVIAQLPKLNSLSLPLSQSLSSLEPLAKLPLKELSLVGARVTLPDQLPAGLGQLKMLKDLRIEYADDIAILPDDPLDRQALRLLFSKRFTDDDIRKSAAKQPQKLYLKAFSDTL